MKYSGNIRTFLQLTSDFYSQPEEKVHQEYERAFEECHILSVYAHHT